MKTILNLIAFVLLAAFISTALVGCGDREGGTSTVTIEVTRPDRVDEDEPSWRWFGWFRGDAESDSTLVVVPSNGDAPGWWARHFGEDDTKAATQPEPEKGGGWFSKN